jgi:hypothetical protein
MKANVRAHTANNAMDTLYEVIVYPVLSGGL